MITFKYRAKLINENKWIIGNYFQAPLTIENFGIGFLSTPNQEKIHCLETDGVAFHIKIETLFPSTKLFDVNNREIFEGDFIENNAGRIFLINYVYNGFKFVEILKNKKVECPIEHCGDIKLCRVIGNLIDNPELLK